MKRGHRSSIIGTPPFVCHGTAPVRARHDRAPDYTRDRQREAIAERDRERARRALWLACERAPLEIVRSIAS
ncbi:hypothetical protein [Sphingopyxis sp. 113P3]|uniref:hypothetical protein n=1 Tax=Sphingopyxis sp. (strain 113P3) TaxID=292913 RepID=UPI0006AD2C61|nr:hypothetical protein [Sphingopyxis sp. 113P3]